MHPFDDVERADRVATLLEELSEDDLRELLREGLDLPVDDLAAE